MIEGPYLLFVGDVGTKAEAKTAFGVRYWRPELCAAQFRFGDRKVDLDLPDLTIDEAVAKGLKTVVVGVAPGGGQLPASWVDYLAEALEKGLDIASGLHTKLNAIPEIKAAKEKHGRNVFDIRYPTENFPLASGAKRPGKRLLTVGTDCAVGKMFTSLAIEKDMRERGFKVDFRATGQTGIFIVGSGVSVDAVVSDFVAGATETLSPAADPDHWDIVEGQGSLFHPSYAGVSLGLLHGSQPDRIVVCHDMAREFHISVEGYALPSVAECIETNLALGARTNPDIACVGVAVNTSSVSEQEGLDYMRRLEQEIGLPVVDPVRTGVGRIVDQLEPVVA